MREERPLDSRAASAYAGGRGRVAERGGCSGENIMVRQQVVMGAAVLLGLLVLVVAGRADEAGDKKARLTPEECERLVKQLVNPGKPPFAEPYVHKLPKGLSESILYEKQKRIAAAYDKLSANIEDALPIIAKHVNDERFSYVHELFYTGNGGSGVIIWSMFGIMRRSAT